MRHLLLLSTLGLILGLTACRRQVNLTNAAGELALEPGALEFPDRYVGQKGSLTLQIQNRGQATLKLAWRTPAAPSAFSFGELPTSMPAGTRDVEVVFVPAAPGPHEAELFADVDDGRVVKVVLKGKGVAVPDCPTPVVCHRARFDFDTAACVEEPLDEGTTCDPASVCVLNATCRAGKCVGEQQDCDDENACTADVCNPVHGCQHITYECPGDGKCQVGTCDTRTGCGFEPAPDGQLCGRVSCGEADVCISGACVVRDPPDGFICAEASPCQGEGQCQGDVCVRPPATALVSTWSYDSRFADQFRYHHDFVVEPSGDVTVSGWYEQPWLRASNATDAQFLPHARRCLIYNGRLACMDVQTAGGQSINDGSVVVFDMQSGEPFWRFALAEARPDFLSQVAKDRLYMARIAALGTDRLAVIYEAFPASAASDNTQCRAYFVVVLDAGGKMISARRLEDPALDLCNHPHPYGVASDAQGNLFLAFSPSTVTGAPLQPLTPTLVWAFNRDGETLWKRSEQVTGGELSIARGLIFQEKSDRVLKTGDGSLAGTTQQVMGRPGATLKHVVPSPVRAFSQQGQTSLNAFRLDSLTEDWRYTLPSGSFFYSTQSRLAAWRPKPFSPSIPVTLAWVYKDDALQLLAVRTDDGREGFMCPVAYQPETPPQMFEVANGALAVMENATTCGECDPPYANSRASFRKVLVPKIELADVPWHGAFGGGGHDHHEEPVFTVPITAP